MRLGHQRDFGLQILGRLASERWWFQRDTYHANGLAHLDLRVPFLGQKLARVLPILSLIHI